MFNTLPKNHQWQKITNLIGSEYLWMKVELSQNLPEEVDLMVDLMVDLKIGSLYNLWKFF